MADLRTYYREASARQRNHISVIASILLAVCAAAASATKAYDAMAFGCLIIIAAALYLYDRKTKKFHARLRLLEADFPSAWHCFLDDHSTYYRRLNGEGKRVFDMRVLFFLADVRIEGVETNVDDEVRLMVAAAAVIPTFAFPMFEYPNLREVLIYPDAFNERFETDSAEKDDDHSSGMVGTGFMNYTLLLSLRDLAAGFSGARSSRNVAIHEFAHLLDKADGSTDGVPAILMEHAAIGSWLELMDAEMKNIERGRSDIDDYALTDHAEFFAVVCEYFFNSPQRFQQNHSELHDALCSIFKQDPGGIPSEI